MTKQILTMAVIAMVFMTACKETTKKESTEKTNTENVETTNNDIVHQTLTDKDGNTLHMMFDNAKDIVTVEFKGEKAELPREKSASGIWYANDQYELSGKGNDVQLKKDGKVIFEHTDQKVYIVAEDEKGNTLNMTFNNTQGTVKAYLNGGEEINLKEKKAASGIWYANDQYELSGKGDHYELKKDGETVFKN